VRPIAPNRGRTFPAEPLSAAEVQKLLAACSRRSASGVRNRALITFLYRSGLRISEVLSLRSSDVDLDTHTIRLLRTKSGHAQTRGFHGSADDALLLWLRVRRERKLRGPLFCTLRGGPMSAEHVRQTLHRLGRKAGIEKRIHPHGIRHTFAVELLHAGADVVTISRLLGHSSVSITARYIDHISNFQAVSALASVALPELAP
jgi:site-specific recombinase XerD